ncbi:MAG: endonuclease I [Bacteroidia bacterium]|jgi:endonuclease I
MGFYFRYLPAHKKSDDSLKFELNQIIKNHTEFTYTSSSTDVWDMLKHTYRDTANANNVILLYSGRSVDAAQEYNSAAGWSREHVWAKSREDVG